MHLICALESLSFMIKNKDEPCGRNRQKKPQSKLDFSTRGETSSFIRQSSCEQSHCCVWEHYWLICANTKKWEPWPTALSTSINYSHLKREVGQLPVHLTSFPPVAVTVLFILCFFLYVACSHIDSWKHARCLSRIQCIHHEHFKQLAPLSEPNSVFLSHLSWFPCV